MDVLGSPFPLCYDRELAPGGASSSVFKGAFFNFKKNEHCLK